MRSQGISPLNLSPDYIKIEDKAPEPKILDIKKRTSWKTRDKALIDYSRKTGKDNQYFRNIRDRTPIVYRFIRFHGKGDLGKGYLYYKEYWDKVNTDAEDIVDMLGVNRKKKDFANHVGFDPSTLSQYLKRGAKTRKLWARLILNRKIIKGFESFEETL